MALENKYDPFQTSYDLQTIGMEIDESKQRRAENIQAIGTIGKSALDAYQTQKYADMSYKMATGDYDFSPEYKKSNPFKRMFMSSDMSLVNKADQLKMTEALERTSNIGAGSNFQGVSFRGKSIPLPQDNINASASLKDNNILNPIKNTLSDIYGKFSQTAAKEVVETTAEEGSKSLMGPAIGVGMSAFDMFAGKHQNQGDRVKSGLNFATDVAGLMFAPLGIAKGAFNLVKGFGKR